MISNEQISEFLVCNKGKKIVLFYGNCHTTAMIYKLKQNQAFCSQYAIFPLKAIQDIGEIDYLYSDIFKLCDVFVHQAIRENNKYGREFASYNLIKRLKDSCVIVAVPNLYHMPMCFFPQYSELADFIDRKKHTCFFRDSILDKAYKDDISNLEMGRLYDEKGIYEYNFLKNEFEAFINKVVEREREWDIKISEFILEMYQSEKLFYDPNHPTPVIINKIVEEILKLLGITDFCSENGDDFLLDTYEMPLCFDVINAFSMEFTNTELRISGRKIRKRKMYIDEYIKQYQSMQWQNCDIKLKKRARSFLIYLFYKCQNVLMKL